MPEQAPNGNLLIMAVVKAIIAIMLVGTAMYCVVQQIETPEFFIEAVLGVLGVYFGFSALLYKQSSARNQPTDVRALQIMIATEVRRQLDIGTNP